jgi:hypothetical protein
MKRPSGEIAACSSEPMKSVTGVKSAPTSGSCQVLSGFAVQSRAAPTAMAATMQAATRTSFERRGGVASTLMSATGPTATSSLSPSFGIVWITAGCFGSS